MLFARCRNGGQPGSPSSLGIWKLHFFLYLMKAEAPQLRSSSWGGRFWEPRDLRDGSWLAGLESGQFLPSCLKCVCLGVPARFVGLPFSLFC